MQATLQRLMAMCDAEASVICTLRVVPSGVPEYLAAINLVASYLDKEGGGGID